MKALFDTNILIDYFNGEKQSKIELMKYKTRLISVLTQIEVLVGVSSGSEEEKTIKNFLQQFIIVNIDEQITDLCITIKRSKKIKLPDAIIWATAEKEEALLITRNTKDFPSTEPFIRIPYHLESHN